MHQQLTREMAMSRIADYHRQAEMYRLRTTRPTVDQGPQEEPPPTPLITRWALAGVLLSTLVLGGVAL
jgi:hypothetical protein